MIGKVSRGSDVGGLLRYLYGPGRANTHTNAHLVASWLGDSRSNLVGLEPPAQGRRRFAALADRLTLPLSQLPSAPDRYVWQCSMRLAAGDRSLTDGEWASVARAVLASTGIAPDGDPGGCRWVAIRHADDHIHVVAVLARQDGAQVDTFRDWPKVHAAARACEARLGLTTVAAPSRSTAPSPKRAEREKATRHGRLEPYRVWLADRVRDAAARSTTLAEFTDHLTHSGGVVIGWRYSTLHPGEVTGYKVGRIGDEDPNGQQIWYSGSKLGADLSLPRIVTRWEGASPGAKGSLNRDLVRARLGALVEPLLPHEVVAILRIVRDLRRILRSAPNQHNHPPRRGPRLSDADLRRLETLVREALDPVTATALVTSPAWPALATTLTKVENLGLNPASCLVAAAGRRELTTADDAAAVLHHRLAKEHALPPSRSARPVGGARPRGPRRSP